MNGETVNTVLTAVNFTWVAWWLYRPQGWPPEWPRPLEVLVSAASLVFSLIGHSWAAAAFDLATLILLFKDWWNRKGKRVAKAVGSKSLAILAAIVEKAREAGTPAPRGVRA